MSSLSREAARSSRFHDFVYRVMGENSPTGAPGSFTWDRWIRGHFKYRPEAVEVVRTPDFMLSELERTGFFEGDCDCVSVFYATIIKALGYRVRFVAIRYSDPTEFQHVFIEYHNGTRWLRVDPTTAYGTVHTELDRMVENV